MQIHILGICIEFDSDELIFKIGNKVKYSDTICKLNIDNENDINANYLMKTIYEGALTTKYKAWEYEQEYRLFSDENEQKYNSSSIKAIYFGMFAKSEDMLDIKNILINNNQILYYKEMPNIDSYQIKFKQIFI